MLCVVAVSSIAPGVPAKAGLLCPGKNGKRCLVAVV